MIIEEIWKPVNEILGYENFPLYSVSNKGNVKNNSTGKLRKLVTNRYNYIELCLYDCDGNKRTIQIHRLVALGFLPNPNNLPMVNHKDENTTNNCVDNLEWCTQKYNINYGSRNSKVSKALTGRKRPCRSGKNNNTSHAVIQLTLDGTFVQKFEFIKQAEEQGFNATCISDCCRGQQKSHKGYKWIYQENYVAS